MLEIESGLIFEIKYFGMLVDWIFIKGENKRGVNRNIILDGGILIDLEDLRNKNFKIRVGKVNSWFFF